MEKVTIKLETDLSEQVLKYAGLKKLNKSQAIRDLIRAGIDVTAHESELLKEVKNLNTKLQDMHDFNKKGFNRLASLSVKNGIKIFTIFHAVMIHIFLRTKDVEKDEVKAKKMMEDAQNTAITLGTNEYNKGDK